MKSNIFLGSIGALVGAMVGAVLWVVLYQVGIIASLAGIAIVALACKGYQLLGKALDLKGVLVAILIAVLVLLGAHVFCWGLEIYNAFQAEYDMTLWDGILMIPEVVKTNDLMIDFVKELAMGLVLICVGGTPYVKKVLHYRSAEINSNLQ